MTEFTKDELAANAVTPATPKAKAKGSNIVSTTANSSALVGEGATADATAAAELYNRTFAATFVEERQKGAEALQNLIISSNEATHAAITSVDIAEIRAKKLTPANLNLPSMEDAFAGMF